jgi:uncharacterized membrane protein
VLKQRQKLLKNISMWRVAGVEKSLEKIPLIKFVYVSVVLVILNLLFVVLVQTSLPPEIPLYYGLAQGYEQLAESLELTIPTVISLFIIIANVFLASLAKKKFLQQALVLAAFAVTVFSTITTIKIIFLIGSF